ncbi:UDP-N-acetylmuramoyl-L-alanyl-D-glutamate--2,6-diaminopimelate ligase [Shewanella sp. SR44-3]|uniref:UDP-N-acetylmuramoyl-L-alanyl-D-glutamate--2, 6-diaminopimelate ligase n=1 Tax=Shewanella sp. SR44-3 TaxID=2760936 RepID=UPI0015F7C04D|nr:UDP-N-acetylmuramoyl-L-alanyl-D-glutamate--2,6-diaminopimelate ligase [Shewanella sp. SR44-3]MBB1270266.1 UDP-N-acetylmuramoyl-L-alanyl-D-glutamate--2,6-diaminopimelate ligase [Shewanella sp. SR44-3]
MMRLSDILAPWFHYAGVESASSLNLDSRKVTQGGLFIALPGHQVDGRTYIEQAKAQGAVAALVHTDDPDSHGKVENLGSGMTPWPVINFFQLNSQLSAVAAQFYPLMPQNAQQKMALIGITGTNGKTSVSQLIAQLTCLLGGKAAVMGTLGNGLWGELIDSGNTTADAVTIMAQLNAFNAKGCDVCAMEVSSHGLVQSRVTAVPFDIAVFTNLTRDHLDYHGDMASYASAKKRLFQFASLKHALLNLDDATGARWFADLPVTKRKGFSVKADSQASYYTDALHFDDAGVQADIYYYQWNETASSPHKARLVSPLLGEFNLSNLLAAIAALHLQGVAMADLLSVTPMLVPVAGRMERFPLPQGASLVVDYAHTPDAIEQALKALRIHCHGQLWCVFGCGGDRDKGKRPLMAQAAERFADKLMVTSDNARSEAPGDIISDVLKGLTQPDNALIEVDRTSAVKLVATLAKPGDIVLLAGKGHETYQEIAGQRLDYDERALALALSQVAL